jgi:hypothetical protein
MACGASQASAMYRSGLLERLRMVRGPNPIITNVRSLDNLLTSFFLTFSLKDRIMYTSTEDI